MKFFSRGTDKQFLPIQLGGTDKPAAAGLSVMCEEPWMPASAGMTEKRYIFETFGFPLYC